MTDHKHHKHNVGELVDLTNGNTKLRGLVLKCDFGDEVLVSEGGRDFQQYPFSSVHEPIYLVGFGDSETLAEGESDWSDWFRERELMEVNPLDAMSERLHEPDRLTFVQGDATAPQGDGPKIIVHICNNLGAWGAGFVMAISKRWKGPEARYRAWASSDDGFGLGRIQIVLVESSPEPIWVINMVAQHGIGFQGGPPIRYNELQVCLREVAIFAKANKASIHMPRIGCGLAGGNWETVEQIVKKSLCDAGLYVTVYDFGGR
jgi:O-acetyl-ADP-ribose deacetylase (regulator of RNase III)